MHKPADTHLGFLNTYLAAISKGTKYKSHRSLVLISVQLGSLKRGSCSLWSKRCSAIRWSNIFKVKKISASLVLLAAFRWGIYSGIAPSECVGHFRKMVVESQTLLSLCTLAARKLHQALVLRGDLISATGSWNSSGASAAALLHIKSLAWSYETVCVETSTHAQLHLLPGRQDSPAPAH